MLIVRLQDNYLMNITLYFIVSR